MMSCLFVLFLVVVTYKLVQFLLSLPRIGRYGDRYILVTGCGQGFGYEAVKRLDSLGCHVFAGCRREESVLELSRTFSDRVHPFLLDVSNRDSVRKAFEYVSSKLPKDTGLWGVVNNAGIGQVLPFELLSVPMYERLLSTNLYGTIDVTMTFLPLIKKARGRIVNVSSYSGRIVLPVVVSYCVSKFALEAFNDGLRRSLRPFGCKVLLIEPGSVKTSILSAEQIVQEFEDVWKGQQCSEQATEGTDDKQLFEEEREKLYKVVADYPAYGSIDSVIDAYCHALFGVFPSPRYLVGIDTKFLTVLQSFPEWISDSLIRSSLPQFRYRT